MRRTGMWLSVLAMAIVAGNASAITADGDWSDWFSYNPAVNNVGYNDWNQQYVIDQLAPGIRHAEPYGSNGELTHTNQGGFIWPGTTGGDGTFPGYGGQQYDVEQLVYTFEDDVTPGQGGKLYIGLVTGFPPQGLQYLAGDFFFGFGAGTGLTYALGVSENAADAARLGKVYFGGTPVDPILPEFNTAETTPYRMSGGIEIAGFAPVVEWGQVGQHYFLEICLMIDEGTQAIITNDIDGGLNLHWTMGCGNDYIDVKDNTPFAPVPEPTTMVLLGMGVLGMAMRARRPVC